MSVQTDLATLLDQIFVDTHGDDEQLGALHQAFEDEVPMPADAFVIGEPVSAIEIDYDGNVRRGLVARCRREDGSEHLVSATDVAFPSESTGALYAACYRQWLGLDPLPVAGSGATKKVGRPKATEEDLHVGSRIELVALAIRESAVRCRLLGKEREVTLRSAGVYKLTPGEIVTLRLRKQWRFSGHPYVSGEIESSRLDVAALGLTPLRLENLSTWDPDELAWAEEWEELDDWVPAIADRGPRPAFEMEQVLPGADLEDAFNDPILQASELRESGDPLGARELLMDLLALDLRCLDAHAHLGNLAFDRGPQEAFRHYEMGMRIGELSLENGFDGLLPWGYLDNRPFLRCLHGYGLCLWRVGRSDEAAAVFERMLWLSPNDNQGARFLLAEVRSGEGWKEHGADS